MISWKNCYWTLLLFASAVSAVTLLTINNEALAHEGHPHRGEAGLEAPLIDGPHMPKSEAERKSPGPSEIEKVEVPGDSIDQVSIEETSVNQQPPVATSQTNSTQGFSIGLGESLLGLIITAPFLLTFLKNKTQS